MAPTGYSLTVEMDVTAMRETLKREGLKFFPAYLWLTTRNLNRQTEFKMAVKDGVLGYYDTLSPLYAAFHEDDHTFSFMWQEYTESFSAFHKTYLKNQRQYGDRHGVLAQPQTPPPENAYTVSCLPWVDFSHLAVHSYGNKPYYFPSLVAGKFREREGKILMPLSLTCHHATTDGYHVRLFLEGLQDEMHHFRSFL